MFPSELKILCAKYHLNPSKQYGQNYLISGVPIEKMIEAAELSADDTVVEIGPGFGILTFSLAPLVKKVIAYEIEKKLLPFWEEKKKEFPNVEIVWGNVMNEIQPFEALRSPQALEENQEFTRLRPTFAKGYGRAKQGFGVAKENYKVIANIPYQITSNLLRTLLEMENKPERIIIMVQKEVAERICAKAGDMSLLAVSVQYYGEPKIITKVSRGNFWPSPSVDSAILAINRIGRVGPDVKSGSRPKRRDIKTSKHSNIQTFNDEDFFRVVKAGFANKRKQLWHNLSSGLNLEKETVKNILKEITGNEKIRAEDLSVEDWEKIVKNLEFGI